ncbi:MAG: hypothetical protein GX589_00665 [Deltaproteobacteria bacterium]|nr:hypothetical protein [Deltaproteobacteria bacterium]
MRRFFRKKRTPLLIALALFISCSSGALFAYDLMLKADRQRALLFGHAALGNYAYLGMNHDRCVAFFATSLKRQGETSVVNIEGILKALYHKSRIPLTFKLTAYFNALGQMIGSFVKITFSQNQLALGTLSINPIRVKLSVHSGGKLHRFKANIPGPLELVEDTDKTFRLRYTLLKKSSATKYHQQTQALLPQLDFSLIPATAPMVHSCFGANARLPRSGRTLRANAASKQRRRWRKIERDLSALDLSATIPAWIHTWSYLKPLLGMTAVKPKMETKP